MPWPEGTEPILEIETSSPADEGSLARFVTWIPWDSGFRGSGLRVGDLIIGHGDLRYGSAEVAANIRVGDSRFSGWLNEKALKPDGTLALTVLRGDETIRIEGKLGGYRSYTNAGGNRTLGESGPIGFEKDGFDYAWDAWYRQFVDLAKTVLAGWDYFVGRSTQNLAKQMVPFADRIAYLQQHYPAAFGRTVQDDYEAMKAMVAGEKRNLSTADIAYRTLGAIRAVDVTAAADRAFAAFLAEMEGALLKNPPNAPNAFTEDTQLLIGKLVCLPALSKREVLYETKRSWYWSGRNYLIDRTAEPLTPLHVAMREYTEKVDPKFRDSSIIFIGIVQPEPALVCDVDRNITVTGVRVAPITALINNASDSEKRFFVDLRPGTSTETFAGETALDAGIQRPKLTNGDPPERVLQVAFEALKAGDMETWLSCYASWNVSRYYERDRSYLWVDRTWVTMSEISGSTTWDKARQRLLDDVYGLEVAKVGPIRVVFDATQQTGDHRLVAPVPRIVEEVQVRVNHIGRAGDEYRTFAGPLLHRQWKLQRMDDGPWRITVPQAI